MAWTGAAIAGADADDTARGWRWDGALPRVTNCRLVIQATMQGDTGPRPSGQMVHFQNCKWRQNKKYYPISTDMRLALKWKVLPHLIECSTRLESCLVALSSAQFNCPLIGGDRQSTCLRLTIKPGRLWFTCTGLKWDWGS